jgi:hypothetical protein
MKLVNNLMKAPEVAATMQEFSKEMTKVPQRPLSKVLLSKCYSEPALAHGFSDVHWRRLV